MPDVESLKELVALPAAIVGMLLFYRLMKQQQDQVYKLMSNHIEHNTEAVREQTNLIRELRGWLAAHLGKYTQE